MSKQKREAGSVEWTCQSCRSIQPVRVIPGEDFIRCCLKCREHCPWFPEYEKKLQIAIKRDEREKQKQYYRLLNWNTNKFLNCHEHPFKWSQILF